MNSEYFGFIMEFLTPLVRVLLFLLLLMIGYFMYKVFWVEKRALDVAMGELYSPAYTLLLSKRSKKIESEEFRKALRILLMSHWHLAKDPSIRKEMKEWLRNNRDPEGYRLQMLLELKIDKYYRK